MRVLLDTTFARRGPSGTGIYIERLAPALRDLGVEVVEAANERRRPPAGGGAGSWRNAAEDRRWSALELPRRARDALAEWWGDQGWHRSRARARLDPRRMARLAGKWWGRRA